MEASVGDGNSAEICQELGSDFSHILTISVEKEKQTFDQSLDDLLTKLDEYLGVLDMVRSDTNLCLNKTIPSIYEKGQQMQGVFDKIDQLERFVAVVKSDVAQVEGLLDQAESELATRSPVAKLFSAFSKPFFSEKKSAPQSPTRGTSFVPPPIFKTSDYLENQTSQPLNQEMSCNSDKNTDTTEPNLGAGDLQSPDSGADKESEVKPDLKDV